MGSAASNEEALERRRIEREMRLGLHARSNYAQNANSVGVRSLTSDQHLGWPAHSLAAAPAAQPGGAFPVSRGPLVRRGRAPSTVASGKPQFHAERRSVVRPKTSPILVSGHRPIAAQTPASSLVSSSPARARERTPDAPIPATLCWVGAPSKSDQRSPSPMDLLLPARRALELLKAQEGATPLAREAVARSRGAEHVWEHAQGRPQDSSRYDAELKPSLKRALYLLSVEEIEDRTYLLKAEVDAFDGILALFSYAVEMEYIRIAAFELFDLERKSRKTIGTQEQRERRIIHFWLAENYDDAKLAEKIRVVQQRHSRQRTPSRSPWRFPRQPSPDGGVRAMTVNREAGGDSYLANTLPSPPPVPPAPHRRGSRSPHTRDARFGPPKRYVDDPPKSPDAGVSTRFGVQREPPERRVTPVSRKKATPLHGSSPKASGARARKGARMTERTSSGDSLVSRGASSDHGHIDAPSAGFSGKHCFAMKAGAQDIFRVNPVEQLAPSRQRTRAAGLASSPAKGARSSSESRGHFPTPLLTPRPEEAHPGTARRTQQASGGQVAAPRPDKWAGSMDEGPTTSLRKNERPTSQYLATGEQAYSEDRTRPFSASVADVTLAPSVNLPCPPTPRSARSVGTPEGAPLQSAVRDGVDTLPSRRRVSPREPPKRAAPVPEREPERHRLPRAHQPPPTGPSAAQLRPSPADVLADLSPIESSPSAEDIATSSSVYLDPFDAPTPRRPWSSVSNWKASLAQRQEELDRRIMHQRSGMFESALPMRAAPSAPISPRGAVNGFKPISHDDLRERSATVHDRFAALLDASV